MQAYLESVDSMYVVHAEMLWLIAKMDDVLSVVKLGQSVLTMTTVIVVLEKFARYVFEGVFVVDVMPVFLGLKNTRQTLEGT